MINPEDEILVDLRTSCTKDEAVAKMLGWLQGHIRQKYVRVSEHGVSADQLPSLHSLDGSLQEQLLELQEAARRQFIEAAATGAAHEAIQAKEEAVIGYGALINKAALYLRDIDDEMARGESSALRVDQQATDSSGVVHIALTSLDRWAHKKYGITIIEPAVSFSPITEDAFVDHEENESDLKGGLSKTKADNLYASFAFLVEAYATPDSGYRHKSGEINVKAIANFIEGLAKAANKQQRLSGQTSESIKDRIEYAMTVKQSKLPPA